MSVLNLQGLCASVDGKTVLQGLDLCIGPGEVHAIVGPNGAGKSTLGSVLSGNPTFKAHALEATFLGDSLLDLLPEERSRKGLFLAFQYPVELPGVNNTYLLRAALNAHRASRGQPELDAIEFMQLVRQKAKEVGLGEEFLSRNVNEGFSGGEKKRNEVLQMAVLEPKLAILDEVDSGLDMDALKEVAAAINRLRTPTRSFLVITHYKRMLDLVRPDKVHVLRHGRIIRRGGMEILDEVDAAGFDSFDQYESLASASVESK